MKAKMKMAMKAGGLVILWLALAGADRGCFTISVCDGLDEAACLENEDCRPVYQQVDYGEDANGLRCLGGDGLRCIVPEPVFDHCEKKPDCGSLDEEQCLSEPACQAVYGYPADWLVDGQVPRCLDGLRCIPPDPIFLECLDAGADPCDGLEESACLLRPACEPVYSPGGCSEDVCWDGSSYEGCRLRQAQCQTDQDCYAVYGAPSPDCMNWWLTCEAGVCVEHCDTGGCQVDADCLAGQHCEVRCGNGWCEGVCVDDEWECTTDAECGPDRFCEPLPNVDCIPGAACPGTCRDGAWMQFAPVLCPQAPWLEDEAQNPERYYGCYYDCCPECDCGPDPVGEEICRVRTFLLSLGILAHDVRDVHYQDIYCVTCENCPRGDIVYVLVSPDDVERMMELGFSPYEG